VKRDWELNNASSLNWDVRALAKVKETKATDGERWYNPLDSCFALVVLPTDHSQTRTRLSRERESL